MTVKELRATAASYGLKGYSRMNKAELEAAIDSRILELREETGKRIAEQANSRTDKQAQDEQTDNMRDILNALPASKIRRIARIVKLPGYTTFTTRYLRGILHAWIFGEGGCNGLRALAVKLSRDDFMEVVNVCGTEDLRDELSPIFSDEKRETLPRAKCIALMENAIFRRENYKAMNWYNMPSEWLGTVQEVHHRRDLIFVRERQEKELRKREKEEEINARREYCRQRKEAEDFRNAFQNAQRTLAAQVAFITRYMQAKPATAIAALPATVQHQPAVVEQTSTDSYYSQNYDEIEHICFIRRVKNGHVPRKFLAELSPEEYAQVMQEVADMEKKEQERERAQQAQPQPELLPATSCFYTPNPEPIIVDKCDQVFRFEIGKLYQLRGDYGNPSHRKSVIAKVIATADDCVHFEIHGKVFYSSDSWFIRYHDEEGNETHTISQWAQICYFEIDGQTDTVEAYADEVFTEQPQPEVVEQTAPSNQDDDDPDPTPPSNGGKSTATVRKTTHANPNYGTVHGMTTRELRKAAKNLDIKGYAKMDRAQLDEVMSRYPGRLARRAFDFSLCSNEEILRSRLRYFSSQQLEITARNLKGKTISLPVDDKLITKKFLIDAIVRVYFPNANATSKPQAIAPNTEKEQPALPLNAMRYLTDLSPRERLIATAALCIEKIQNMSTVEEIEALLMHQTKIVMEEIFNTMYNTSRVVDRRLNKSRLAHAIAAVIIYRREQAKTQATPQPAIPAELVKPEPVAVPAVVESNRKPRVAPVPEQPQPSAPVQKITLPHMERCPHCGSRHKPYFSYKEENNACYATRRFNGGEYHEWKEARLTCRDCGHVVSVFPRKPYPDRQAAMDQVVSKWCLASAVAANATPVLPAELVEPEPVAVPAVVEDTCKHDNQPQDKITCFDYDDIQNRKITSKQFDEICKHNAALLERCDTPEDMRRLLNGVNECTMNFIMTHLADAYGTCGTFCWSTFSGKPITRTLDEMVQGLIDRILYCRKSRKEYEAIKTRKPVPVTRKNTPAPATRKPRRVKTIDTSRQILISFGDEETHATASTPAKPKRKVTRKPRIKRDYSRQLVFVFDEVTDSKTDQRKAA